MKSIILINGEVSDGTVPVTDSSVLRGDGCFEVLKSYGGIPFAVDGHLDRLEQSASALKIPLPDRDQIALWIDQVSTGTGDVVIRVVVTRGSSIPGEPGDPLVIVFAHSWDQAGGPARLLPVPAPWHAAGESWALAGAKILSYAPNLSTTRQAVEEGYDDAFLIARDGTMLEGPTFSVAWVVGGVLETPTLDLGILDSITRRLVLEDATSLGIQLVQGRWPLARLADASEVMALSTTREVQPVSAVGELQFGEGPVTSHLARAFAQRLGGAAGEQ